MHIGWFSAEKGTINTVLYFQMFKKL